MAVGIIVRVILMPISAHPFDVYAWYKHSMSILQNGPLTLQGFPPLWYHYLMVPIAYAYSWLANVFHTGAIPIASIPAELNFYPSFGIQVVPGLLFNFVVKFSFLVSDILVALLLYRVVQEITKSKRLAETAALFWFLNPYLIWISAGWGMWDTLPALFSLASFYFLLKKRFVRSAIFLSLGVATKLYPALFLVPFAIYIVKSGSAGERWKSCARFFSIFAAASVLFFLPYMGLVANFFSGFFLPPAGSGSAIAIDPVNNPLGFGLTYWSLYLLNRLVTVPTSAGFVSLAVPAVIAFSAAFVLFIYWRVSRFSFRSPVFDLSAAMLLSVAALFLSYRIICEQFFVWVLPFLAILCVGGRVRGRFFWGASIVALLYSVLNCPLPFFFLPLSPWVQGSLLNMVHFVWWVEPLRIASLAILGCLFSALLLVVLVRLLRACNAS